jgi:hypothetical protein
MSEPAGERAPISESERLRAESTKSSEQANVEESTRRLERARQEESTNEKERNVHSLLERVPISGNVHYSRPR